MHVTRNTKQETKKGEILVYLLIIIFLFSTMMMPVFQWLSTSMKAGTASSNRETALQIAEAGVNYYQWHLAHYPTDYSDGNSSGNGPFVHAYTDMDTQTAIGQFSLMITPPATGSTIVTIISTGSTYANPNITRTVTARYGIPSLAVDSFLSNSVIWIGNTETINGQMQSNNGIKFDGSGNAPIMSAKSTYTCPTTQGSPCPATENGVWGGADQATRNFWQYPVPAVDFSSLTSDLAGLKSNAQSAGIYLPPSNAQGYSLVFNSGGTVSVYKVNTLKSNPSGTDVNGATHNEYLDYNTRTLQYTSSIPTNGIIYIEDKTWVEGTVHGRVMVTAATLPYNSTTAPTIYIPNNILYSAKDGTDVLGLLAQKDIVVTYHAPSVLEIDAAMIAQNGSAQFFYVGGNLKTSISIYGSIMTFGQWTWSWVDGNNNITSGYPTTTDTYDSNLLYGAPPGFPLSAAGYSQLSWKSD